MLLIVQGLIVSHPDFIAQHLMQCNMRLVSNMSAAGKQFKTSVRHAHQRAKMWFASQIASHVPAVTYKQSIMFIWPGDDTGIPLNTTGNAMHKTRQQVLPVLIQAEALLGV